MWTGSLGWMVARYEESDGTEGLDYLQSVGQIDGAGRDDARRLAQIMMQRVRRNAEVLAKRLGDLGWETLTGEMVGRPTPRPFLGEEGAAMIGALPLPLALEAFWEVVGSLDFGWNYRNGREPDLFGEVSLVKLDPLYLEGADQLSFAIEEWRDRIDHGSLSPQGPFRLDLAPDNFHKANFSGGSPYGIMLPAESEDPLFFGDNFSVRFTTYLRRSFRWGGFPGLADLPHSQRITERVSELTEGFEPF